MAKIRCKYLECEFLDENYCSAAIIELDSNKGCLTFSPSSQKPVDEIYDSIVDEEDWYDRIDEDEEVSDDDDWMDDELEEEDDLDDEY